MLFIQIEYLWLYTIPISHRSWRILRIGRYLQGIEISSQARMPRSDCPAHKYLRPGNGCHPCQRRGIDSRERNKPTTTRHSTQLPADRATKTSRRGHVFERTLRCQQQPLLYPGRLRSEPTNHVNCAIPYTRPRDRPVRHRRQRHRRHLGDLSYTYLLCSPPS